MRVLVVEDDPGVSEGILSLLRSRQFDACAAPDGAAALELVHATKPDVILLDLAMPHMGGDEFLEHIRDEPGLGQIPVIVMSEWARNIAPAVSIAGWLPKPFEPRQLFEALGSLLEDPAKATGTATS